MVMADDRPAAVTPAPTLAAAPGGRRRRPLRTRLASGHLLMILAGVLTFVLVANALRSRDATVAVVVATSDVASGAVVDPAATRTVALPAASPLRDSLVGPELLGAERWVAARRIVAGEPLARAALTRAAAPGGLRAMSVPIAPDHAAGGELDVGDRVDIISAEGPQPAYVVRNAEVLGVAPRRGSGGLSSSSSGQFYVTIAVEADVALRLAAAIRAGKLEILRATGAEAGR